MVKKNSKVRESFEENFNDLDQNRIQTMKRKGKSFHTFTAAQAEKDMPTALHLDVTNLKNHQSGELKSDRD